MVGWHPHLNGHEFEQTPGDGEGQVSLTCCSLWGCKESDTAEPLNNNLLRGNPDLAPSLRNCFFSVPPLSLPPLPALIST